ncbi:MAG: MBL fold metallo-hydrolase [Coriobacteriales bacterium]|jgi:phosphoribosyl 1,2-cyclic phosphate phosphodiesterase|nr:MBL fold metallo-hydrolase [Coriobacteriales bacterium]
MPKTHLLTFLGTGASCGVPSYYCGCPACEEALRDPRARRDCSSILIQGEENTQIDTAPELRSQYIREGIRKVERVLFTHEHFDHIGGLPQLEYLVRLQTKRPLPVYGSAETLEAIGRRFDFMADVLEGHQIDLDEELDFDGVRYTPLAAAHCPGTFGYLIETGISRCAYFCDSGRLPEPSFSHLREYAQIGQLDYLIIDATFNGENWMPASHHSIDQAIDLAQTLGPKHTLLTHLSMHYDTPITLAELEQRLADIAGLDIKVAYDGLKIRI